jgi:hypothetical protein
VRNSTVNYNAGAALSANGQARIVVTRSMIAENGIDFIGQVITYNDNNFLFNSDSSAGISDQLNYE